MRVLCIEVLRSPDHNLTKIGSRHEPTVVPASAIVQPFEAPFQSGDLAIYRALSSVEKIAIRFCHRYANYSARRVLWRTVVWPVIVLSGIWILTASLVFFVLKKIYTYIDLSFIWNQSKKKIVCITINWNVKLFLYYNIAER